MNAGMSAFAGIAAVITALTCACTGPVQGGLAEYTEAAPISAAPAAHAPVASGLAGAAAPATAITAATAHPGPEAAVPPPAATPAAAATPPPAAAPAVTAAAAPAIIATTPTTATPAVGSAATPASTVPAKSGFNAGSGTALPDGKTVEYHIPDGTGGTDWNPKDNPIRVRRGMVLRLIDDDKSTRSGGHWLHTNGQPCPHGLKAIGTGFDCNISMNAPMGKISGVFEHNVANGIGLLHIEVVADAN